MIIVPISTDRRLRGTPWVNYGLIAVNALAFLMTRQQVQRPFDPIREYFLDPSQPQVLQFVTYQFLHASIWHLLGNMLFLYVFGNALEDRLGKVAYLAFYLAGGVLAGLGHGLLESAPVLGASGSVAAVSGAYLALFPLSNVTMFYWFFVLVGSFEVSGLLLIGFYIAMNLVSQLTGSAGVAYLAHLTGYAFGFAVGMTLLWVHLVPREPYDFLALVAQRRRRAEFRRMTRRGYHPWEAPPTKMPKGAGQMSGPPAKDSLDERQQKLMALRAQISAAAARHELDLAAQMYSQLLQMDPESVMAEQLQLDIANQLMSQDQHESAALAYERFLNVYHRYAQRQQVELILGLIYARYLNRKQRARELLTTAVRSLDDPEQKKLAQQVLDQIVRGPGQ